jgi:hypothetical protein
VIARGYIAHFQFKSEEDFLRRWRRGGFSNGEQWRSLFETGDYKSILATNDAVYDTYLADYWHRYTAPGRDFGASTAPTRQNVALNKPSWQSSIYQPDGIESPHSQVSGGGNNGLRTGTYGFHTQFEAQPWWAVDLLAPHHIAEIHIYNRGGDRAISARASELDVVASPNGQDWTSLLSRTGPEPFGLNGRPLVVQGTPATPYRFILLRLRGAGTLHLDEVEIYGQPN